jgi:ATP-dependent Clp protease ATP-binding subunit ClpA
MFERFTDSARAAVVDAQAEARALGHGWIGTEHLLLAVVRDPDRPVARQLAGLGLTHDRVHAEVVTTLGGHHDDGSALRDLGTDLDAVRARVEERFGPGALDPEPTAPRRGLRGRLRRLRGRLRRHRRAARIECGGHGHIPFSRSAKKALELALRESVGLGSREILVEHLVLGLMRAEGLATTLVTRLGVAPADVRREVLDGLGRAA